MESKVLTSSKKAYFRKVLEQNLEVLLKGGDRDSLTEYSEDKYSELLDMATAELDAGLSFRFRERESNLVRKIYEALKRLEDGTFGICDECGRKISEKRLLVRPIATLCIACKQREEEYERLFGT
jgi:DnaK suppressor protein